ncbi:MAG: transaldolase, partial [Chloroflexi bacterium]|nr:transaldolase [Chloroflexota bacterium]
MSENPLKQITDLGQSLWYDNIERSMITEGKLAHLIAEDYIVGVTSNP